MSGTYTRVTRPGGGNSSLYKLTDERCPASLQSQQQHDGGRPHGDTFQEWATGVHWKNKGETMSHAKRIDFGSGPFAVPEQVEPIPNLFPRVAVKANPRCRAVSSAKRPTRALVCVPNRKDVAAPSA
jgi:hypothetical protein